MSIKQVLDEMFDGDSEPLRGDVEIDETLKTKSQWASEIQQAIVNRFKEYNPRVDVSVHRTKGVLEALVLAHFDFKGYRFDLDFPPYFEIEEDKSAADSVAKVLVNTTFSIRKFTGETTFKLVTSEPELLSTISTYIERLNKGETLPTLR